MRDLDKMWNELSDAAPKLAHPRGSKLTITITGAQGSGKTRLANWLGDNLPAEFGDLIALQDADMHSSKHFLRPGADPLDAPHIVIRTRIG